jgi:signal peptidase I
MDEFTIEDTYLEETNKHFKKLKKRTIIVLVFYMITIISSMFERYQDFDVIFTSNLFRILIAVSVVLTLINISLCFMRKEFYKESMYRFVKGESEIFDFISVIPVFVALIVFLNAFFLSPASVEGSSMQPNYYEGDTVLITHTKSFERFDVVIVRVEQYESHTYYIKRVIGLPGEVVTIHNNHIYIDGQVIDESFLELDGLTKCSIGSTGTIDDTCTWTVPQGEYFVLGDNREYSNDSRSSSLGTVEVENLYGKVIFSFAIDR